jgi:hypothetical protein
MHATWSRSQDQYKRSTEARGLSGDLGRWGNVQREVGQLASGFNVLLEISSEAPRELSRELAP